MVFQVSTSFALDRGRIERMLRLPGGLVDRNLRRRVARVQQAAERLAPGSMGRGIRSSIRYEADGPVGTVTSTHHASLFVTQGTGIYGPTGRRITPRRARALRFVLNGRVVYAASVKGQKPNDFMIRALREAL